MKTLEQHNTDRVEIMKLNRLGEPQKNGIICPDCDSELYDSRPLVVLPSEPEKKNINCQACGFTGFRLA